MRLITLTPLLLVFALACGGGGGNNGTPATPAKSWNYVDPAADSTHWRVVKVSSTATTLTLALESPDSSKEIVGLAVSVSEASVSLTPTVWPADTLLTPASNLTTAGAVTLSGKSITVTKQTLATITVSTTSNLNNTKLSSLSVVYKNDGRVTSEAVNMNTVSFK